MKLKTLNPLIMEVIEKITAEVVACSTVTFAKAKQLSVDDGQLVLSFDADLSYEESFDDEVFDEDNKPVNFIFVDIFDIFDNEFPDISIKGLVFDYLDFNNDRLETDLSFDRDVIEDDGIGYYEYWGRTGYDSRPTRYCSGTYSQDATCVIVLVFNTDDNTDADLVDAIRKMEGDYYAFEE